MFVICANDAPFCIANVDTEEQAGEMCRAIQSGFDNRKVDYLPRKVFVHLRVVPLVHDIDQINFPIWDSQWPTIEEE